MNTPESPADGLNPGGCPESFGRLLIVEDNPSIRRALASLLGGRGWIVSGVGSIREALVCLDDDSTRPDWVLVDLMMPDGSGVEILKAIGDRSMSTRAVVVTGAADGGHLAAARNYHPWAIVAKPVEAAELHRIMIARREGSENKEHE